MQGAVEILDAEVEEMVSTFGHSGLAGMSAGAPHADITTLGWLQLAPMLGRYARQEQPIRGRRGGELQRQGRDGEIRAGIPKVATERVEVNGRTRIPDKIDRDNSQVIEVKNVNRITSRNDQQIQDELDYAKSEGYTMTLVVDHRTELSPKVQKMWDDGEITVIFKELDDNIPKGHQPTPFVPSERWSPPASPRSPSGIPAP